MNREDRTFPSLYVVIVAAGSGVRAGAGVPKQFRLLGDRPLVWWSMEFFENIDFVKKIALVLPARYLDDPLIKEMISSFRKILPPVAGGEERGDSVRKGMDSLPEEAELVAIHDGARPFPSVESLKKAVNAAHTTGGAIPAISVTDTVKEADENGIILKTMDRSNLFLAQTPQVFQRGLLLEGYKNALHEGLSLTDDAAVIEAIGEKVQIVPGSRWNIKITTEEDFSLARMFLRHLKKHS